MTDRHTHFGYDKKTINKIMKTDMDNLIYDTKVQMIINTIIFSLSEAEKNGISKRYILRKVQKYMGLVEQNKPILTLKKMVSHTSV